MTPSLDHFPFARPHLHGVCAKAARLHPSSLGRAATTFNHSEQRAVPIEAADPIEYPED